MDDTKYNLLLHDDDSSVYQPPRFHTTATSTIQDFGKRIHKELHCIDLFSSLHTKQTDIENDAFDAGLDRYLVNMNPFEVKYIKFPLEISKKQVRCKNQPNQMRLNPKEAKIVLHLVFQEKMSFIDIYKVKLKVKRLNTIPNYLKYYTGFVNLHPVELKEVEEVDSEGESSKTVAVYGNLDNFDEEDSSKNIYELSKSNPEHNQFVLCIEVLFHDGSSSNFTTRSFTVKGQKFVEKRKAPVSPDSTSTASKSSRLYDSFRDPSENKKFADHQRLICEIIEAKQGIFDNLEASIIKSGNGDIAYHFALKDQYNQTKYEPGEIVGFTTDDDGKVVIDKLAPNNATKSFLKGVVTESQYIEANLPTDRNVITATICMLGVVPVRVMGPVYPGEGLFASQERPGTAVAERFVDGSKTDAHIGYAFERADFDDDEVHEVQALVSILSSAGQDLCVRQLSNVEKSLKHSIKFNTVRSRRCNILLVLLALLGCALVGTVIYQAKVPCSLYKKYMCKEGNVGHVKYWYWGQGGVYFGYKFGSCKIAWDKTIARRPFFKEPLRLNGEPRCLNGTTTSGKKLKFNYYINSYSCCGIDIPGSRYLFAVDENCELLYRFHEVYGYWQREDKICSSKCNIVCGNGKPCDHGSHSCPVYELRTM